MTINAYIMYVWWRVWSLSKSGKFGQLQWECPTVRSCKPLFSNAEMVTSGGERAWIYSNFVRQTSKRARQGSVRTGRGTKRPGWGQEEWEWGETLKITRWQWLTLITRWTRRTRICARESSVLRRTLVFGCFRDPSGRATVETRPLTRIYRWQSDRLQEENLLIFCMWCLGSHNKDGCHRI